MGEFYNLQLTYNRVNHSLWGWRLHPGKLSQGLRLLSCVAWAVGGKKITGLKKYSNWLTVFKSGDRSFHKKAEKCKSNNKKNRPQERRDVEWKKGMIFGRGGAEGWCCPEDLRDCRSAVSGRACTSIPLHVLFLPHKMLLSPSPPCKGHQISPPM